MLALRLARAAPTAALLALLAHCSGGGGSGPATPVDGGRGGGGGGSGEHCEVCGYGDPPPPCRCVIACDSGYYAVTDQGKQHFPCSGGGDSPSCKAAADEAKAYCDAYNAADAGDG
jgi:hypothetical protein